MQISNPFLNKYILPEIEGESVLDVGSGIGYYGYLCKYAFYKTKAEKPFSKIDAIEADPETVLQLKQMQIYNDIHQISAVKLPFEDNSYDTVLSIECLEHFYAEDLEIAFRELYRVCNKKLIISTPPPLLCSNPEWCKQEIEILKNNDIFINYQQYMTHMYGLHKCSIDSDMFMSMKFQAYYDDNKQLADVEGETRIYIGKKEDLDISNFQITKKTSKWELPFMENYNYKIMVIKMLEEQIKIGE